MNFSIRRLTAADAEAYRDLRLEALRTHPDAYADSAGDAARRPLSWWEAQLADRVFFGAHAEGQLKGTVNLRREQGAATGHRAWLLGMYVAPTARGTGMADALVEKLFAHAAEAGVLHLYLGVAAHNETARRFYERHGFSTYGREPRALRQGDNFIDEFLMAKPLDE
jgi:ribosomal protein S18 acetylase RimI-like enzyme